MESEDKGIFTYLMLLSNLLVIVVGLVRRRYIDGTWDVAISTTALAEHYSDSSWQKLFGPSSAMRYSVKG